MKNTLETVWGRYGEKMDSVMALLSDEMRAHARLVNFPQDTSIVVEGDTLTDIYFIQSGVVDGLKRYEDGKDYQYFTLDHTSGAIGLLELMSCQMRIIATIITRTDVTALRVNASELYASIMEDPVLLRRCAHHLAMDLYRDSGRSGKMFYQNGFERVCAFLTDYYAASLPSQPNVTVKQTYDSIASQLCISVRTVGRAMKTLRERGLCTGAGKYIRIDQRQYREILSLL